MRASLRHRGPVRTLLAEIRWARANGSRGFKLNCSRANALYETMVIVTDVGVMIIACGIERGYLLCDYHIVN